MHPRRVLGIVAALAAGACASAALAGGALYRVERAGVAPSWLYGTLHSADPRVARIDADVARALDASRRYAPELVMGEGDLADFLAGATYDDGRRLGDALDAASLVRARSALDGRIDDDAFARLKPWAVFLMLTESRAPADRPTLDTVLLDEARRRRMTVVGLELPEEQVASFDAVPVATQAALVRWALDRRGELDAGHERAVVAWLAGDLAALRAEARAPGRRDPSVAPHFDRLVRHLVDDRNALLAHRLWLPLRDGRVFVAVGASHLEGPKGLVALVRAQGYRVRRVRRPRARRRAALLESRSFRPLACPPPRSTSPDSARSTCRRRSTSPTSTPIRCASSRRGSSRRSPPGSPSRTR